MATPSLAAQAASRRNGARSKGPKTRNGRKISARNAFKHGLRARSVLDRGELPDWLLDVEAELAAMLRRVDPIQRERLDDFLLACWQVQTVDRLIEEARERLFAGMAAPTGAEPTPAFMAEGNPVAALRELARLHAYRRRFRARRDRCIAQLFRYGLGDVPR